MNKSTPLIRVDVTDLPQFRSCDGEAQYTAETTPNGGVFVTGSETDADTGKKRSINAMPIVPGDPAYPAICGRIALVRQAAEEAGLCPPQSDDERVYNAL